MILPPVVTWAEPPVVALPFADLVSANADVPTLQDAAVIVTTMMTATADVTRDLSAS